MNQEEAKNQPEAEEPSQSEAEQISQEAIQQGLIYPPPPEFYAAVPEPAPEQKQEEALAPQQPIAAGNQHQGPVTYYMPVQGMPVLPQGGYQPVQPVKRSKTWIWLVSLFFGGALIACCIMTAWSASQFSGIFNQQMTEVVAMQQVGQDFYSALQQRNYQQAYSYLAADGNMSLENFTNEAKRIDQEKGAVQTYTVTPTVQSTSKDGNPSNSIRLQVDVHRQNTKEDYPVVLFVKKVGQDWKIASFSGL